MPQPPQVPSAHRANPDFRGDRVPACEDARRGRRFLKDANPGTPDE